MTSAHYDSEGTALTVLTVRGGEASIRDFRFDCHGETSCRPNLGELLQLLERRHADVAIFLAHPNLVGALIDELHRRGRKIPEMVIAPPSDAADARVTVSVSLSGLSESAYPQELLARLYEALRAAQNGAGELSRALGETEQAGTALATPQDGCAQPSPAENEPAQEPTELLLFDADAPAQPPGNGDGRLQQANDTPSASALGAAPTAANELGDASADAITAEAEAADEVAINASADAKQSAEVEEISARLERVLNQRLQRSQH